MTSLSAGDGVQSPVAVHDTTTCPLKVPSEVNVKVTSEDNVFTGMFTLDLSAVNENGPLNGGPDGAAGPGHPPAPIHIKRPVVARLTFAKNPIARAVFCFILSLDTRLRVGHMSLQDRDKEATREN